MWKTILSVTIIILVATIEVIAAVDEHRKA